MPKRIESPSLYRLCLESIAVNLDYWTEHYERHVLKRRPEERRKILFIIGPFDELSSLMANDLLELLSLRKKISYPSLQLILNSGAVTRLNLEGVSKTINDSFVYSITKYCSQLKQLNLRNCRRITPPALIVLSRTLPNVLSLNLSSTAIDTNAVCCIIKNCKKLLELILRACKVSDETFLEIGEIAPDGGSSRLRCLDISDSYGVTERGVSVLLRIAPNLQELHHHLLFNALTSLPLNPLADPPSYSLRYISCLDAADSVDNSHFEILTTSCPCIERLELRFSTGLTKRGLSKLARLEYLRVLTLDGNIRDTHENRFSSYNSRVKPVLESCGKRLRTLTLEDIENLDLVEVLMLCPNLNNLTVLQHGEPGNFRDGGAQRSLSCPSLSKLSIWSRIGDLSLTEKTLACVLLSATRMDQLQLFQVDNFTGCVLRRLIAEDSLTMLTSLDLQECNHVTGRDLSGLFLDETNSLQNVNLNGNWNITRSDYDKWMRLIKQRNLDVKLVWR